MELTSVKGVGESAAKKLEAAGVTSVEDLAQLDLRKHDVEGLSSSNIAQLRDNAHRLLAAQNGDGGLELVPGLGPSARHKLETSGVETIADLAGLDLRQTRIDGLSTGHVQKLKHEARHLTTD